ncbi:SOD4 dismutase, partial [Amia calva]|nr:SOD4 dismutase [Amia calva]
MAGVMGWVKFDSSLNTTTVNLTGICGSLNLSLNEFPVIYGHFPQPCQESNIGASVFSFNVSQVGTPVSVPGLFRQRSSLDDLSLVLQSCNATEACATIKQLKNVKTWQAKFFSSVAGDVYIRQNENQSATWILSDLVALHPGSNVTSVSVFTSQALESSCDTRLSQLGQSTLTSLGQLKVGSPLQPVKSRLEIAGLAAGVRFILINLSMDAYACAEIRQVELKKVNALISMKGAKGSFSFSQASPFDLTEIKVNLTNLGKRVGAYHVHDFPVPQAKTSAENLCSNDNVGGHWNPFKVKTTDPTYPKVPGATHDLYETGDLSGRHGSLAGMDSFEATFTDWNLPLFGRNSIVGRSVVIHLTDGSRLLCGTIGYPGEVVSGKAIFKGPVVGTMVFSQLKNNPYSDLTMFLDLSFGNSSASQTENHNWHVHVYPISSETDYEQIACDSTKGHLNPFNIDTVDSSYNLNCKPDSPFACEVGDFAGKHQTLTLNPDVGKVTNKLFFTDTTSWMSGVTSILGRSVVIHAANKTSSRFTCANITLVRFPSARTGSWFGPGKTKGIVQFSQSSPLDLTVVNVSLSDLQSKAGGYHVHILPLKNNSANTDPCSNENIMGHFNPFAVNQSSSPVPGTGTEDQFEIGDLSGKYGLLSNLDRLEQTYVDNNLPLLGPNSIVGRSLVIHYANGSR